ncbi:TPA: fimbria/pilus outer membrane usher protein [Escherichia coli]|uniref:fimbria/pilus outer membrane usher protein n=1 Tax=Escherichia coli TaxID=562 RepID=UPI000DDD5CE6|nr:fimbria/pilus outer membrane usher protein [Escherichia coli]UGK34509.1 fimbria/pilus outer membrane usher protein [Escherichia coli]HAI4889981.1 fimbria/pilus outer membrane usher protein [Escherichia coli]HAL3755132.1 fimbria/pilus outer membrane usher protein [Escherichia coli]HDJ9232507.1 fimbria/pilus outer membrane usher protein [Escherichia coli]HDS5695080.1 fimbria/pilus outer membrane usher protein [Escherichia coli]
MIVACSLLHAEDVIAHTYTFDASMLKGKGVDVTLLEEGTQLPGTYPVDIILNGSRVDSGEIIFHTERDSSDKPYLRACLTREMLVHYGVKIEEYQNLFHSNSDKDNGVGENCADLSAIPQATETYQFAAQQLVLEIPQVALRPRLRGIAPEALWDDGIPAFLLNWQANIAHQEHHRYGKRTFDNYWASLAPGFNIGPWRIRSLETWNKGYGQPGAGKWESTYVRAERGLNAIKARLILGEDYTPSDIFDSVPFRGGMVKSDESMVPYNQRVFAPVVRGIARTQARIEVRQNGYLIQSQTVAPGVFALTDLPVTGSSSDLQVTVQESDGTTQVFALPFTTPAIALREGYLQYNVAAGQYRALDHSVAEMALGNVTAMYGLPWGLTLFGGFQGAESYQAAALGMGWSLGRFGAVSLDTIYSHGQQKGCDYETGDVWRLRYSKSFESTGTGFTATNYQYSSDGYHSMSDVLDTYRNDGWYTYRHSDNRIRRTLINLNQSLGRWGYLGLNGSREEYRGRPPKDYISASYNTSWNSIFLSVSWSRNRNAGGYYTRKSRMEDNISMWISIPLGRWLGNTDNDISTTTQIQRSAGENTSYEVGMNGRAFDRRLYWDVRDRISPGSKDRAGTSRLNLQWSGSYGELTGMYSYNNSVRQMDVGMSGSIVAHSEGITFGQWTGDTVALIAAPGVSGVSVGDLPGIKTDFRGYTLVGYMTPYQVNELTLDPTTFPEDVEIAQTDRRVVPTKGAVVRAKFTTRVGGRALVVLSRRDGTPLPFGAVASIEDKLGTTSASAGVVDDRGRVYLSGLSQTGKLKVQWGANSQCYANYRLPKEKGAAGIFLTHAVCI